MRRQGLVPYMFLAPFLIMFGVFWVWPIGTSVYYSFTRWDGMSPPRFVGVANYVTPASSDAFYSAVSNTLVACLAYEALLVVFATVLAFLLNAAFLKGRALFQAAILAPITVAMAIVAL